MKELKKEFIKRFLDANEDDGYHIFIDEQDCNDVWNWIAENLTPIVSRVELPVKPACERDIRIDELNKLQQTLNPYQMNENDFFRAMMDGTIKNTILMRINELSKSV